MKTKTKTILTIVAAAVLGAQGVWGTTVELREAIEAGRKDLIVRAESLHSGAPAGSEAGRALSLAGDYLAVGASNDKVRVYTRGVDGWVFDQELVGPQQAGIVYLEYGEALAFSDDARQLLVKGVIEGAFGPEWYLFRYLRNAAGLLVIEDILSSQISFDEFGTSLAIDGDLMVVGAPAEEGGGAGAVIFYEHNAASDEWEQVQRASSTFANSTNVGVNVAIDGDVVVVSTRPIPGLDRESEVYFLNRRSDGTWVFNDTRLEWRVEGRDVGLGRALALQGRDVFIGVPEALDLPANSQRTGMVVRMTIEEHATDPEGIQPVLGEFLVPEEGNPRAMEFGSSLAVSGDVLVVGSPAATDGSTTCFFDIYQFGVRGDEVGTPSVHQRQFEMGGGRGGAALAFDGCELFVGRPDVGTVDRVAVVSGEAQRVELYDGEGAPLAFTRSIYQSNGGLYEKRRDIATVFDDADETALVASETAILQEMRDLEAMLPGVDRGPLEDLLLDLYYDRALGRLLVAKDQLATLDGLRLENSGPGEFVVDAEIAVVEDALGKLGGVLREHVRLLEDGLGFPVGANEDPLGLVILRDRVPGRALEVPEVDGVPVADVPGGLLADGYKDYRLVLQALLEHARTAVLLAELYRADGDDVSEESLTALVGDTQRFVYQVRMVFAGLYPAVDAEASGLVGTETDLDLALSELTAVHQAVVGGQNLLGYSDDFLLLTQGNSVFDSFDQFIEIVGGPDACTVIDPNQLSGLLGAAITAQGTARGLLGDYKENESDLAAQFRLLTQTSGNSIRPRLYAIVGENYPVESPEDLDDPDHPYNTPGSNVGSEIWQQLNNLQLAGVRIDRNRVEIGNLREKIEIEVQRRAVEAGVNASIADLHVQYGDRQASLTEEIASVEAAQASWESVAGMVAASAAIVAAGPVGVAMVVALQVNQVVQITGELAKGELEGDKERLAAQEKAQVVGLEDQILGANSRALIANLLLEMKTLELDSHEAAIQIRQEYGRLVALYTEKEELERRLVEVQGDVASSYFADPVHRLRATNATREAHRQFEDAQRWVFYALRSLEYKWNRGFRDLDTGLETADVFRMRNAWELGRLFVRMCLFDNERTLVSRTVKADWFSIKEDYFGYIDGETYVVTDLETGEAFGPLSAEDAFRKQLELHLSADGREIELDFSTVREAGDNLFRAENYLDKIDWVKVRIPGQHGGVLAGDPNTQRVGIDLHYGGLNFIRQQVPGPVGDRADRLEGEFTTYNTKEWEKVGDFWQPSEQLSDNGAFALLDPSGVRPVATIIPGTETASARCENIMPLVDVIEKFEERSVATTGWVVDIPVKGPFGANGVVIGEVEDVELFFCHSLSSR